MSLGIIKDAHPYFVLSTELVNKRPLHLSQSGYLDFEVAEWPLSGGTYQLTCYIEGDGITQDWVDDAAKIVVADGDFFGTGRLYHAGWQGSLSLFVIRGVSCTKIPGARMTLCRATALYD